MAYKIGTLRGFMTWTKQVIRDPKAARGVPKRWFDSEATAHAALPRRASGRDVSAEAMVKLLSPVNLKLLRLLATRHPQSVQELADMAGRKQASVSRTLKRLAEAGIVAMARGRGRERRPELVATRVQLEIDLTTAKRKAVAGRP
jgi:DNA-binding MarR family transcriptional regulator